MRQEVSKQAREILPILCGEERKTGWDEMVTKHVNFLSTSKSLRKKPLSRKGISPNLVNSSFIGEKSEEVSRRFLKETTAFELIRPENGRGSTLTGDWIAEELLRERR